jgi:hypothetical protein
MIMAIRPIDMQVMVPKLQEVAQMRQLENQRSTLNQNQIANNTNKQTMQNQQTVIKSEKDEGSDNHADAKEESKNKYGYKPPNKEKKEEEPKPPPTSYHKIDIKV